MAEKRVLKAAAHTSVVLRLSHISGNSLTTRRSLHEKLLRIWAAGEKAKCRVDEIKCPLSAGRLGDLLVELCERPNLTGIYHYAGLEPISRYDMARRIAEKFGLSADEFVEPVRGDREIDLTLDMSCLARYVKTRSCMFGELLDEVEARVAAALERLAAGDIAAAPTTPDACAYCPVTVCDKRTA